MDFSKMSSLRHTFLQSFSYLFLVRHDTFFRRFYQRFQCHNDVPSHFESWLHHCYSICCIFLLLQKRLILRKLSHSVFNLIVNCMSASVGIHEFRIMIVGIAEEKKNIDLSSHLKIKPLMIERQNWPFVKGFHPSLT